MNFNKIYAQENLIQSFFKGMIDDVKIFNRQLTPTDMVNLVPEGDWDKDGLTNEYEKETSRTDPLKRDTDGDTMGDGYEWTYKPTLDPLVWNDPDNDADGDGTSDGEEEGPGPGNVAGAGNGGGGSGSSGSGGGDPTTPDSNWYTVTEPDGNFVQGDASWTTEGELEFATVADAVVTGDVMLIQASSELDAIRQAFAGSPIVVIDNDTETENVEYTFADDSRFDVGNPAWLKRKYGDEGFGFLDNLDSDQFLVVMEDKDDGDFNDHYKLVDVEKVVLRITDLDFDEVVQIMKDDSSELFDEHEWQDNNQDGDADDTGDVNAPVAFVQGTTAQVMVTLNAENLPDGAYDLRGIVAPEGGGNDSVPVGMAFEIGAQVQNGTLTATAVANAAWLAEIGYIEEMTIDWEVSPSALTAWIPVGQTKNQTYILLDEPVQGETPFWTSVHIASTQAEGKGDGDKAGIIEDIFALFEGRQIDRISDGVTLVYGHPQDHLIEPCFTTSQMLAHPGGVGRCQAWSEFLRNTTAMHGISGEPLTISPDQFAITFAPTQTVVNRILYIKEIAAQGSGNATYLNRIFLTHQATTYRSVDGADTTIYDPSYGSKISGASIEEAGEQWERANLESIGYHYTSGAVVIQPMADTTLNDYLNFSPTLTP